MILEEDKANITPYSNLIARLDKIDFNVMYIKEHSTKKAVMIIMIAFLSGYITGTKHKDISPYIGDSVDTLMKVLNLKSKVENG